MIEIKIGENRLEASAKDRLREMCCDHGFKPRGQAYFRIHSEEILQVIKFEYERVFSHYSLDFGLVSMYSELRDDAFVSNTYLDRHSVCYFDHYRDNIVRTYTDGRTVLTVRSPEDQLAILETKGFAWFDSIRTQEQLLEALKFCDEVSSNHIFWNDSYKIYPFLAIEDYQGADYVLAAIFNQHLGPDSPTPPPWKEEHYHYYATHYHRPFHDLLFVHQLIADKNYDGIKAYLQKNYQDNLARLQFLKRK